MSLESAIARHDRAGMTRRRLMGGLAGFGCVAAAALASDPVAAAAKKASAKGAGGYRAMLRPPVPLANLRVHRLAQSGRQTVTGGANEDLLIVHPEREVTGQFLLNVEGFRGIYYIGAAFDPAPMGWLKSPNGRKVDGIGSLLKLRTHKDADRPFVYLSRVSFRTSNIVFGDFLQFGGAAPAGKWGGWPDLYRYKILAEPLFGWTGYWGGSFSQYVSHSDFVKAELGGMRHGYAADIDVTWGYQHEYVTPTHAFGFKPYKGPDGHGELHYWNFVARMARRTDIGSDASPKAFFFSRGSDTVAKGEYYTVEMHEGGSDGQGNWIVPWSGERSIAGFVHPGAGAFAPDESNGSLTWPRSGFPGGRPMVTGRIINGAVSRPPTVVGKGEVGLGWRVTSRSELLDYIDGGYAA